MPRLIASISAWHESGLEDYLDFEPLLRKSWIVTTLMYLHWFLLSAAYYAQLASFETLTVPHVKLQVMEGLHEAQKEILVRQKLQFYFALYNKASTVFQNLFSVIDTQLTVTLSFDTIATVISVYFISNALISHGFIELKFLFIAQPVREEHVQKVDYVSTVSAVVLTVLHNVAFSVVCEKGEQLRRCSSRIAETLVHYHTCPLDFSTKQHLDAFLLRVTHTPIQATAGDYFVLNRNFFATSHVLRQSAGDYFVLNRIFFATRLGSVLTYLVVLVQFRMAGLTSPQYLGNSSLPLQLNSTMVDY
ncbi:unnamed protein product [Cyprideis torosa]|uniref:Uncharacterized protein n=1 Tax=Cyprideis torosa TaxID=163714 RepID=A0A7R8WCB7_9CRUS|nr:unnamed protein product [Cyprideis torosa]CAG0887829.1 unnamed protein product [Cyprideis torosa]